MRTEPKGYGWLSTQLFFDGELYGAEADRILFGVVEPLSVLCREQGWARRFFFIRYSNLGHHIRFRLYGPREALEHQVKPRLQAQIDADPRIVRTTWEAYEPETFRYGGRYGVALAERVFQDSSTSALALLRRVDPERRSTRLGKGLLATLVMLHTFCDSRQAAAQLIAAYGSSYLAAMVPDDDERHAMVETFENGYDRQAERLAPYVETAWSSLVAGEPLTDALDRYREQLQETRRRMMKLASAGRLRREDTVFETFDEAVHHVVPSYIHMMNNRLGVTTQEESYLSLVLFRTLHADALAPAAGSDPTDPSSRSEETSNAHQTERSFA
ncbi:MAG: thiopeptide-type bacteriocin biosynthesis protein [Acidobacteriota bacterium]